MTVRGVTVEDVVRMGEIAEASRLFPAAYMADMVGPALAGGGDVWRVAEGENGIAGFAFARMEELTDRTWNILALAVDPADRGRGHASRLLERVEADMGARLVVIETTQRDEQAAARAFYAARGYEKAGHIRDFYAEGEDKIVFRKALT